MTSRRNIALGAVATILTGASAAQAAEPLRVVWLLGNPVQARVGSNGLPQGPGIDVANALGRRLGRPVEAIGISGTAGVLDALRKGVGDVALIAFDPSRAQGLAFTPAYLLSLNSYAVLLRSPITSNEQVDRVGLRVGVIATDSGGLYLRRTLTNASLIPVQSIEDGLARLQSGVIDVLGGAKQRLADIDREGDRFRILPGHFYAVPQSMAVRADDQALLSTAAAVVLESQASGALRASIGHWGLVGAAPPWSRAAAPSRQLTRRASMNANAAAIDAPDACRITPAGLVRPTRKLGGFAPPPSTHEAAVRSTPQVTAGF